MNRRSEVKERTRLISTGRLVFPYLRKNTTTFLFN